MYENDQNQNETYHIRRVHFLISLYVYVKNKTKFKAGELYMMFVKQGLFFSDADIEYVMDGMRTMNDNNRLV